MHTHVEIVEFSLEEEHETHGNGTKTGRTHSGEESQKVMRTILLAWYWPGA